MQAQSSLPAVLILCGGRGSRLSPVTAHTPKVLAPVRGQPMLQHILDLFCAQGFKRFVLATGYLSEQVEEYAKKNLSHLEIQISHAGLEASMLKRLAVASGFLDENSIVAYGDTFIDLNYRSLLDTHTKSENSMTLVTGKIQNPFGIVQIDENSKINSFKEKPTFDYYIGCLAFKKSLLSTVPVDWFDLPDGKGLVRLFETLAQKHDLNSFPHQGLQISFNTESELQSAEKYLSQYYTIKEAT